jgi:uncharacterized membrane protein YagU involved in acid resistance
MNSPSSSANNGQSKNFLRSAITAGLLAGLLDATAASIQFFTRTGKGPVPVFRYVASGLLGKSAFAGNQYAMAAWGLLFHFLIAMTFTFFFFLVFPVVNKITGNKFLTGILFGIFTWMVMNLAVVPLSGTPPSQFDLSKAAIAALILIVAIGLPVSLLAHRYYTKSRKGN